MGNTRPLPQPVAPSGEPAPTRAPAARPQSRARRYLKRAAITLLVLILIGIIGVGVLWVATPSANEATQLAAGAGPAARHRLPGPAGAGQLLPAADRDRGQALLRRAGGRRARGRPGRLGQGQQRQRPGRRDHRAAAREDALHADRDRPHGRAQAGGARAQAQRHLLQGADPRAVRRGRLLRARLLRARAGQLRLLRPPGGGPHDSPGRDARGCRQRPVPGRPDRRSGQRPAAARARHRADGRGR